MNLTSATLRQWMSARFIPPVDPNDRDRAALYYKQMADVYQNFEEAALPVTQNGLGPFFSEALRDPGLLSSLANVLDPFVTQPIVGEMTSLQPPPTSLQDYYDKHIFDDQSGTYEGKIAAFEAKFPRTTVALNQATQNFVTNILSCCRKIMADIIDIQTIFSSHEIIRRLVKIQSTGSDFHKGGAQVLILTFEAGISSLLKIVYKPSDVEIDCLLVGDSKYANALQPNSIFMQNSLAELFNECIDQLKDNGQCSDAHPLPTYRILPRRCMSREAAGPPPFPGLRDLYGYIEYLEYYKSEDGILHYYNQLSAILHNYVNQDANVIISRFYRLIGQWTSLACTFGIRDLHVENLIVHDKLPYLIDLENSLVQLIADVSDTELFASRPRPDTPPPDERSAVQGLFAQKVVFRATSNLQSIEEREEQEPCKSRLYLSPPIARVVVPEPISLLGGIADGFTVIANIDGNKLNAWWARLDEVLVRAIPVSTQTFAYILQHVFLTADQSAMNLTDAVKDDASYNMGVQHRGFPQPPGYAALAAPSTLASLEELDVPVFYRRSSQIAVVDSSGAEISFGPTVNSPDGKDTYTSGQTNFYTTNPTADLVAALANLRMNSTALANRRQAIIDQVKNRIGCGPAPSPRFKFVKSEA